MQQDSTAEVRNDLYPSIGDSIGTAHSHIYLRAFTENTDNAGPIVTNVSLPNGEKVDDNQTVTSAIKDIVVSFSEDMLTMFDATNAATAQDASYIALHAVDNPANWYCSRRRHRRRRDQRRLRPQRVQRAGAQYRRRRRQSIEQINFSDFAYGTNRYKRSFTLPKDLSRTTETTRLFLDGSRRSAQRIYSQGYAPDGRPAGYDGRDFELDFSVIRLNLGFTYSIRSVTTTISQLRT